MPVGVMSEPSVIAESVIRGANSFEVLTLREFCSAGLRVPCVVFYATRKLSCSDKVFVCVIYLKQLFPVLIRSNDFIQQHSIYRLCKNLQSAPPAIKYGTLVLIFFY